MFTNHKALLAAAAREFGLHHDGGYTLSGEREGIPVGVRLWTQLNGDNTNHYTTVDAGHPVPLRMSLRATRQNALGRFLVSTFGGEDLPTGHPAFDAAFQVRAREPLRAQALFAEDSLRDAMLAVLGARRNDLSVTDVASSITLQGWQSHTEELRAMLNSTHSVATQVRAARGLVPVSDAELRASDALAGAGSATGLQLDREQLRLEGQRASRRATVSLVYHAGGGWTSEFHVRFPAPLGLQLRLLPQRGFLSALGEFFGTQDIQVGHPAFDAAFKVKGQPEAKVAELLGGSVAERILALHAVAAELEVGDEGIRATAAGLMDDAPSLTRSLEVVDGIAAAIVERAWGGPSTPYR